jgi:hypothetical protein
MGLTCVAPSMDTAQDLFTEISATLTGEGP